ncbi:hypothetical protein KBB96_05130 [Luteolibacter ambystomatis]|uniref:Uncharacterized protein n=1 Tax=Luteolibacter ambystomatis TaxID=2824561 RepID=A0A975J1F7_9BACT|nr:hypothetical protein [Luteolibacter ambystomatis]QUE52276.1 hypothetical protein KBB96_05130 [Luteolibacter ambystomatis]
MDKRYFIRTLGGSAIGCIAGCVPVAPAPRDSSQRAWQQYIHYSPFSNRTGNSPEVVALISRRTGAIPLDGVSPPVSGHIREAAEWTRDFPICLARANAAAKAAYESGMELEEPAAWVGGELGTAVANDGENTVSSKLKRAFGSTVGEALARWSVKAWSQHSANAAFYQVMNPLFVRGRQLSLQEHAINRSLNLPTTDYLRRLIGAV